MENLKKATIDEIDKKILKELQENCRLTSRELSKKLNMPITTIHQRVTKLREREVIKKFSAIVDPEIAGFDSMAIVFIHSKPVKIGKKIMDNTELMQRIAKLYGVMEVHMITGRYDIMIKIRASNEKSIGNDVATKIRALPGVISTETFIVVGSGKETMALPL